MRCKKHYADLSSTTGVCASCLRERLLSLLAAQEQVQPQIQNINLDGKHRIPANNSRKSDHSDQLFYTTPHRKPTSSKKKRSFIRFISFPNMFRSRNRKPFGSDSLTDPTAPNAPNSAFNATSSSSWFSSIISGGRHRRNPTICNEESTIAAGAGPVGDRGMSPVRNRIIVGGDETESVESWKNTARRTPVRRGGSGGHMRSISGFCLSPLVRASPNMQWKGLATDVVLPGEVGVPARPQLLYAKSLCGNRSRKFADFGRYNLNR